MGSALQVGGTSGCGWICRHLGWGDFSRLAVDSAGVQPAGVSEAPYRPLLDMLDDNHKLVEFDSPLGGVLTRAGRRLGDGTGTRARCGESGGQ